MVIRDIELRSRQGNFVRRRKILNKHDYDNNSFIAVLVMIHLNSHASLRKIKLTVGIPRSIATRYLRNAHYHPYHITVNQTLTEEDY